MRVNGEVTLRGSRWRIGETRFSSPVEVLVAHQAGEVVGVIEEAAAAAARGNWVAGFIAYDAAPGFDEHLAVPGEGSGPLVWLGVYRTREQPSPPPPGRLELGQWEPSMTRSEHGSKVEVIKERIRDGDTYQVNLTMAMTASFDGATETLFARMVDSQPKSYAALIDLGGEQVISVSPELFIRVAGRTVTTKPMKGTAPRGRSSAEDLDRRHWLESSEKERAGNVMIADMIRNDLGRVAVTGSIDVPWLFVAERYPTVWQLTSTVEAVLGEAVGLPELLRATFPAGSVTGAPKVSTMRIISEVEASGRGRYCGAIGYIEPGGDDYELSVAIRTGTVRDGTLTYHVGGGITADSDPETEYEECLWKALVVTSVDEKPDLIETIRYEPGEGIPLLRGHMERLAASARYWEIPFDPVSVGDALSAVESRRPAKVRLILHESGEVEVETHEIEDLDEPVALTISTSRIDPSEPHWFHKTLDRARYPEADEGEVVLVNLDGQVTETNISNVMLRFGDTWVTPPVESGCLPGVYRQLLIDRGEVAERVVTLGDLHRADEVAVTNAVRGWRKAVLIGP